MQSVALSVLGEPNPRLSSERRGELRWGNQGSLSITVYPHPDAGLWFDHEAHEGGGILKFLAYALNLDHDQAVVYLKEQGYLDGAPADVRLPVQDDRASDERRARRRSEAQKAALEAQAMLSTAYLEEHPYLASKGFPDLKGLVSESGLLMIPMRNMRDTEVRAVQTIDASGGKKFQPKGCAAGNTVHFIGGRRGMWWWCEGYATGLSIWETLKTMYRDDDRVAVAFSAGAIAKYAKHGVIVADHDLYSCQIKDCRNRWDAPWGETRCPSCGSERITPPAGERAGQASGLPYWVPPLSEPGVKEDANDLWQREGVEAMQGAFLELVRASRRRQ